MSNVIRTSYDEVTPALAKKWSTIWKYTHNRLPKTEHLKIITEAIKRGQYVTRLFQFGRLVNQSEDDWKLLDGHHTCLALSNMNITLTGIVQVYMEFEDEHEMKAHYDRLDRGIPRSMKDAVRNESELVMDPEISIKPDSIAGAARVMMNGFDVDKRLTYDTKDHGTVIEVAKTWIPEARLLSKWVDAHVASDKKCKSKKTALQIFPVLAVVLYLIRNAPSEAKTFIDGYMNREGLSESDPRRVLGDYLDPPISGYESNFKPPREQLRTTVEAWNLHLKRKTMSHRNRKYLTMDTHILLPKTKKEACIKISKTRIPVPRLG